MPLFYSNCQFDLVNHIVALKRRCHAQIFSSSLFFSVAFRYQAHLLSLSLYLFLFYSLSISISISFAMFRLHERHAHTKRFYMCRLLRERENKYKAFVSCSRQGLLTPTVTKPSTQLIWYVNQSRQIHDSQINGPCVDVDVAVAVAVRLPRTDANAL